MFRLLSQKYRLPTETKMSWQRWLLWVICVLAFLSAFAFQNAMLRQGISQLVLANQTFDQRLLLALGGQTQLAASILLGVVDGENIALLLNALALPPVVWAVWAQGQVQALPGVMTFVTALVVLGLMTVCKGHMKQQVEQVQNKMHEVDRLNRMLTDAQVSLGQKNRALLTANAALRQQTDMLHELAYLDPLTHLPNRRWMEEYLDKEITSADANATALHLVYLDFDHFKRINDQLGHQGGDKALRLLGERLQTAVHPADSVGRLGGDEFLIVVQRRMDKAALENYTRQIQAGASQELVLNDTTFPLSVSLGVASFPEDGRQRQELLHVADSRMYEAKQEGRADVVVNG